MQRGKRHHQSERRPVGSKALEARNSSTAFVYRLVCYYDQTAQQLPKTWHEGINTVAFLKRYSYAHECEYRVAFEKSQSTDDLPSEWHLNAISMNSSKEWSFSPCKKEYIVNPINDLLQRYSLKCESESHLS